MKPVFGALTKRLVIRVFVTLLAVLAFVLSYQHTVSWCQTWGPDDWRSYATAALPEGLVMITILAWPSGPEWAWRRSLALVPRLAPGLGAVAMTLWANGASAQGQGVSALVVAMSPAAGAVLALALEVSLGHEVTPPARARVARSVSPRATGGPVRSATMAMIGGQVVAPNAVAPVAHKEPPASPRGPSVGPDPSAWLASGDNPNVRLAWCLTHNEIPSAAKIAAQFGVSERTGKRVRAAALASRAKRDTPKTEDV